MVAIETRTMNIFGCKCPYCGTRDVDLDREKKWNTLREYAVYVFALFVGTITVSLYMKCRRCTGRFRSYKRRTFPDSPGYYFTDASFRPAPPETEAQETEEEIQVG